MLLEVVYEQMDYFSGTESEKSECTRSFTLTDSEERGKDLPQLC